jgi:hypothetical protein
LTSLLLFINIKVLFKIDVTFKKAGRFIDLETFIKEEDDKSFIKATVTPRLWFMAIPETVKTFAVALYMIESHEIKDSFPWIYNPPRFPSSGEITQGSIERENFANDYGGYMEMVYICATFEGVSPKVVFEYDTKYFLFWSEYLLRKKTVENLK